MKDVISRTVGGCLAVGIPVPLSTIKELMRSSDVKFHMSTSRPSQVKRFIDYYDQIQHPQSAHTESESLATVWCSKNNRNNRPVIRITGSVLRDRATGKFTLKMWREMPDPSLDKEETKKNIKIFKMLGLAVTSVLLGVVKEHSPECATKQVELLPYVIKNKEQHAATKAMATQSGFMQAGKSWQYIPWKAVSGAADQGQTGLPSDPVAIQPTAITPQTTNSSNAATAAALTRSGVETAAPQVPSPPGASNGFSGVMEGLEALCANQNQSTHAITNWLSAIGMHLQTLSCHQQQQVGLAPFPLLPPPKRARDETPITYEEEEAPPPCKKSIIVRNMAPKRALRMKRYPFVDQPKAVAATVSPKEELGGHKLSRDKRSEKKRRRLHRHKGKWRVHYHRSSR